MAGEHITQEQADEYAIGSLEPVLERAVALHLAECPACRDMARDAERLASLVALSLPRRRPSPRLRRRVLSAAGITRPSPFRRIFTVGRAAAGLAAVIVAAGAFSGMVSLKGQIGDLRQQNSDLQLQIDEALSQKVELAALTRKLDDQEKIAAQLEERSKDDRELNLAFMSPKTDVAAVTSLDETGNAIGRLVWDSEQKRVWFVASELPRRPAGETYQIWVNSGGRYYSLGTFAPDDAGFARYETVVPEGLSTYETAVVTIERAGGSPVREGPTVFFVADLSRLRD